MSSKNRRFNIKNSLYFLLPFFILALVACSDQAEDPAILVLTVGTDELPADGKSATQIQAEVYDSVGVPVQRDTSVRFRTNLGTFRNGKQEYKVQTIDDTGRVSVQLHAGIDPGTAQVTAIARGVRQKIDVRFKAGKPTAMELRAAPGTIWPGGSTDVIARILDINGNPIEGEEVAFDVLQNESGGVLGLLSAETNINGEAVIEYIAGSVPGTDQIHARVLSDLLITDATDIVIDPDATVVDRVEVIAGSESLMADGISSTVIRATVNDIHDNPASGILVAFKTTLGAFSGGVKTATVYTDVNGMAEVMLLSVKNAGIAKVSAQASGFIGTIDVAFVGAAPNSVALSAAPSAVNPLGTSVLEATVMDQYDNLVEGEQVNFSFADNNSGASLSAPSAVTDGSGVATITYTAGSGSGVDQIRARSASNASATDVRDVRVIVNAGDTDFVVVNGVELTAGSTTLPVDDGDSYTLIRALVVGTDGNPMAGINVEFKTTLGSFGNASSGATTDSVRSNSIGIADVLLYSGPEAGTAKVTANALGFIDTEEVTFVPKTAVINYMSISTNKTRIRTDAQETATVTVKVLDQDRVPVEGASVRFEATAGEISASSVTTGSDGVAAILFSSGEYEKRNQTATITAIAQGISRSFPIQFTGTTVAISVASSSLRGLPSPGSTNMKVTVTDGGGFGIYNEEVEISQLSIDDAGNEGGNGSIMFEGDSGPLTRKTDLNGELEIMIAGHNPGDVRLTASALNAVGTQDISVRGVPFEFLERDEAGNYDSVGKDFSTETNSTLDVYVRSPNGKDVKLFTTIGVLSSPDAISGNNTAVIVVAGPPDGDDVVAFTLETFSSVGIATLQAEEVDNPSVRAILRVPIVAPFNEAFNISIQAAPTVIAPSSGDVVNASRLILKVTNKLDQIVVGAPIKLSLLRATGGGEYVDPVFLYTDYLGQAKATFTAGSLVSDAKGVLVIARTFGDDVPYISNSENIFFLVEPDAIHRSDGGDFLDDGFEAGNKIFVSGSDLNDGVYTIGVVQATQLLLQESLTPEPTGARISIEKVDAVGVVISGEASSVAIGGATEIEDYNQSTYRYPMSVLVADSNGNPIQGATVNLAVWPTHYSTGFTDIVIGPIVTGTYPNEDLNRNQILDPGEDVGDNPAHGNGVLDPSKSSAGTVPSFVITDENGVAEFDYLYQKNYAAWVKVEISASTIVYGSETLSLLKFRLPVSEGEKTNLPNSPWGREP